MFIPIRTLFEKYGLLLSFLVCTAVVVDKEKSNLAIDIAGYYVKSFVIPIAEEEKPLWARKKEKVEDHEVRPPVLGGDVCHEVVLQRIFARSAAYAKMQAKREPVLHAYAWKDLNLFYGTTSAPSYHLMSRINRSHTTLGSCALATMLVSPTSDIQKLRQRQEALQVLLKDPERMQKLQESLEQYQAVEQSVISFWTEQEPLLSEDFKRYMHGRFYFKNGWFCSKERARTWNKSPWMLESSKRLWCDGTAVL